MIGAPEEPTLYVATLLVLVGASALGLALAASAGGTAPATGTAETAGVDVRVTDEGTRYIVPPSRLRQGCPGGTDCIPSIDDPAFQSADRAGWLADEDLVIGVEIDGDARAYPLRILAVHEIVNDEVGGQPVAVTYCPLCRSGLVFDRRVGNATLSFGVSGKLLRANLVMYDRRTGTYWSQLNGSAVVGPLVPRRLQMLPSTVTTWEEWRASHADTRVLSRNTGIFPPATYGSNPYAGYADDAAVGFGVNEVDGRLPAKTVVYGVTVGNASRAYPAETVAAAGAVNDRIGDIPVLVVADGGGGATVFVREVSGRTPTFSVENGRLVDDRGNRWSVGGEALDGPDEGTQLDRLNSHGIYWFAWSEFHPETGVYRGRGSGG
ncbi:MAG: DUF3179 domain-containing protein [Salinirussus sp.]